MQALLKAIHEEGRGIGTDIVQVGRFLNHRIDTKLMFTMGLQIAEYFKSDAPSLVMTVEASGIALAMTAAHHLGNLPVLIAKKTPARTHDEEMFSVDAVSYTHQNTYQMRCAKSCLPSDARVLIVDDFLANGAAVRAMMNLISKAGAQTIGVAIAIEKGFQQGGALLRKQGIKLLSLAVVTSIQDGHILLENN